MLLKLKQRKGKVMLEDFTMTILEVMKELDVSRQTLHKWRDIRWQGPEHRKCDLTEKVRYSKSSVAKIKKEMYRCDKTQDMFEEVTEK